MLRRALPARRHPRRDGVDERPRAARRTSSRRAPSDSFAHVETVADPGAAVRRAHELGGDVLVTGSLYLLADLAAREAGRPGREPRRRPLVPLLFGVFVLALVVGSAFAVGYIVGKLLV